jgi:hypothetical protein
MKKVTFILYISVIFAINVFPDDNWQELFKHFEGDWNTMLEGETGNEKISEDSLIISRYNGNEYEISIYFKIKNGQCIWGGNGGIVNVDKIESINSDYKIYYHFINAEEKIIHDNVVFKYVSDNTFYIVFDEDKQIWPGFFYPGPKLMYHKAKIRQ